VVMFKMVARQLPLQQPRHAHISPSDPMLETLKVSEMSCHTSAHARCRCALIRTYAAES